VFRKKIIMLCAAYLLVTSTYASLNDVGDQQSKPRDLVSKISVLLTFLAKAGAAGRNKSLEHRAKPFALKQLGCIL